MNWPLEEEEEEDKNKPLSGNDDWTLIPALRRTTKVELSRHIVVGALHVVEAAESIEQDTNVMHVTGCYS